MVHPFEPDGSLDMGYSPSPNLNAALSDEERAAVDHETQQGIGDGLTMPVEQSPTLYEVDRRAAIRKIIDTGTSE